jgi:hypothetical protein
MIFFVNKYHERTIKAIHRIINALFIPTNTENPQNPNEPIISHILLTNSWSPDIFPLSLGLAYPITNAEVTGESIATIREFRKLRMTIAKKPP